jgi:hypothetical protein
MTAPYLDLVRHAVTSADRDAFYRRIEDGTMTRVIRGVSVPTASWQDADRAERHRILVHAAIATTTQRVAVAGVSAAVLHGLPCLDPLPSYAEVAPLGPGGRPTRTLRLIGLQPAATVEIDGLQVVGLGRALADVARSSEFANAVVVADAAVSRSSSVIAEAMAEIDRLPGFRGGVRAAAALEFADPRSESPGESLSRASMHRMSLPQPILQAEFPRPGRHPWRVDFWWPGAGVIGEFDGEQKYSDNSPGTLLEEKLREDDLRSRPNVRGFVRWGWATASSPVALAEKLRAVGVLPTRIRRPTAEISR